MFAGLGGLPPRPHTAEGVILVGARQHGLTAADYPSGAHDLGGDSQEALPPGVVPPLPGSLDDSPSPLDDVIMPQPPVPPDDEGIFDTLEADSDVTSEAQAPAHSPAALGVASQSEAQANLLRRIRRMYIEQNIQNSERLAYDERVDMKSSIGHPMAHFASFLAHVAVSCYWIVSLILASVYAVHFKQTTALRWFYSCLSGWSFTWLILEVVKVTLCTILELSQFYQRRKMADNSRFKDEVSRFKSQKLKKMAALARCPVATVQRASLRGPLGLQGLVPGPPPLPPGPPPRPLEPLRENLSSAGAAAAAGALPPAPPGEGEQQEDLTSPGQGSPPALGDASAG